MLSVAKQYTFAQQTKIDSLWKVYKDKTTLDTTRLVAAYNIAYAYKTNKPDSAIILANKVLAQINAFTAEKRKKFYTGNTYNVIGISFKNKANYSKANEYYLKTIPLFEEIGNKVGLGNTYSNIGTIFYLQADYPKALAYYLKQLKICTESTNKRP